MKYSTHDYAVALNQALAEPKADKDEQVFAKNFLALVQRNGDEGRLKKILDEAGRIARRNDNVRELFVESARELGAMQKKTVERFVQAGDVIRYATDSSLVAGIKITVNDELQFDGTLKAKLDQLF